MANRNTSGRSSSGRGRSTGRKTSENSRNASGKSKEKTERPFSKFRKDPVTPFKKKDSKKRSESSSYKVNDKYKSRDSEERDAKKRYEKPSGNRSESKPSHKYKKEGDEPREFKRFKKEEFHEGKGFKGHEKDKQEFKERKHSKRKFDKHDKHDKRDKPKKHEDEGLVRLNKYLSHAGISSRRDADTLILGGTVKVNGKVVDQLGYKVKPTDVVTYGDQTIRNERKVYVLLNKPKDFITTTDDPQERRTVMELVKPACKERIYPVGRLDRNTTGLLLFTNDGDLATKLMHPKHNIRKVYHVTLNRSLTSDDFKQISEGLELEDGPVKVDDIAFVGEGKKEVGIEIHSGRNRIVRRMFEHLGYDVLRLDRVSYAGLTKKDLPRGKYRFLTEKEVAFLKMLS